MNSRQGFIFNHFKTLFTSYDGSLPFHQVFKKYCKTNPVLGSKDRKILREICYSIFRHGPVWKNKAAENIFLWPANDLEEDTLLKDFYQDLVPTAPDSDFKYPFENLLPEVLQNQGYYQSLTKQPLLWVRVNQTNAPKFAAQYGKDIVNEVKINETFIAYGLPNSLALEPQPLLFEIQDMASQQVSAKIKTKEGIKVWDCCSGAGGKSLFVAETLKKSQLFASDIRPTILQNLKERFKQKRLSLPEIAEIDIAKKPEKINFNGQVISRDFFDIVIADVPCSGSGTWAREPENLSFFNPGNMEQIISKQNKIARGSLRFLKPGGKLYYITCSVFEQENEGIVNGLEADGLVKILNSETIYGYTQGADNLYIAELVKV